MAKQALAEPEPHQAHTTAFTTNNMEPLIQLKYVVASVVYSFIGVIILVISFWIIEKVTPDNLWKELLEKQNIALAIMAAAFMLSIAIIIASAVHG